MAALIDEFNHRKQALYFYNPRAEVVAVLRGACGEEFQQVSTREELSYLLEPRLGKRVGRATQPHPISPTAIFFHLSIIVFQARIRINYFCQWKWTNLWRGRREIAAPNFFIESVTSTVVTSCEKWRPVFCLLRSVETCDPPLIVRPTFFSPPLKNKQHQRVNKYFYKRTSRWMTKTATVFYEKEK